MKIRLIPLLYLAAALAGCEAPTAPSPHQGLAQARVRWQTQGSDFYTFEISRTCFCVLSGRRMSVTVAQRVVTAATYLDSGTAVDPALLSYVSTVPDLFDLIEDALNRTVASFQADYDPTYGYPTRIQIDYQAMTADDEIAFTVRNLATLPTPHPGPP